MDEKTKTTLTSLIVYLKNTKPESWCQDVVKTKDGKNCLFGHIFDFGCNGINIDGFKYSGEEGGSFFFNWFEDNIATTYMVYPVNDGKNANYKQQTPKERCIAYLYNILNGKERTTTQIIQDFEASN